MSSESFPRTPLGDVVTFVNGDRGKAYPKESDYQTHGISFISAADITNGRLDIGSAKKISREKFNEIKNGKVQSGDLLYCLRGSIGKSALVAEAMEGAIASSLVIIRGSDRADIKYVRYFLESTEGKSASLSLDNGSVQPNVSVRELSAVKIPLPTMDVQRELVGTLGSLDDRIDNLRATNAALEAIAQAIFKSWFIDFDPVRAKMEGPEPEGMDADTAALFPSELEESELGLIPKGWSCSSLGEICEASGGFIQTGPFGSQLHASDYLPEGVPVIMPQDLSGRRVLEDKIARISEEDADRLGRHKLRSGDIVFSRRGDVGRHAVIGDRETGWLCGTGCLLVRPSQSESLSAFVSAALARPEAQEWLVRHAVGATMPNLNTKILAALPIVSPRNEIGRHFERIAGPLELRMSANLAQIGTLAALRDSLLPKLISGRLNLAALAGHRAEVLA